MRCIVVCLLLLAGASDARDSDRPASLEGKVTGDSITPLSGVTIGIDGLATGQHFQTSSNSAGYYLIENLRPGSYSVWAEASGYGCILIPRVPIFSGQRAHQDFHFAHARKNPGTCEPLNSKNPE